MPVQPSGDREYDVIVVGAGPSGLLVATELGLAGVRVCVLERRGTPALPRAGTLMPRVLEILDSRGLSDRVLARAHELHTDPHAETTIWAGFHGVRMDRLDTTFPYVLLFAQLELEKVLAERADELGVPIVRNARVTDVAQDDQGVDVTVERTEGSAQTWRAGYVVGADGANSAVRTASRIGWEGEPATRTAINFDAVLPYPWPDPITVVNNLAGWGLSYPLRDGLTRFGLIDAVSSYSERDAPVTIEDAKQTLRRIYGTDFGIVEGTTSRFHNALYLASALRSGRVVLVGESVRVHYPASGVGMNFCLQDAFNLGWKLAAVALGRAQAELLDTFEQERRPEIERLLDDVRRQCAIQFTFSEDMLAMKRMIEHELIPLADVNQLVANNLAGFSAHYGSGERPLGDRLRDLPTRDASGPGRLFAALRDQQYVAVLPGDDDHTIEPAARDSSVRVVHVSTKDCPPQIASAGVVLVRPDGHVAALTADPLRGPGLDRWLAAEMAY